MRSTVIVSILRKIAIHITDLIYLVKKDTTCRVEAIECGPVYKGVLSNMHCEGLFSRGMDTKGEKRRKNEEITSFFLFFISSMKSEMKKCFDCENDYHYDYYYHLLLFITLLIFFFLFSFQFCEYIFFVNKCQ